MERVEDNAKRARQWITAAATAGAMRPRVTKTHLPVGHVKAMRTVTATPPSVTWAVGDAANANLQTII